MIQVGFVHAILLVCTANREDMSEDGLLKEPYRRLVTSGCFGVRPQGSVYMYIGK